MLRVGTGDSPVLREQVARAHMTPAPQPQLITTHAAPNHSAR